MFWKARDLEKMSERAAQKMEAAACQVRRMMPIRQPNFGDRVQFSDFIPPFNEPCSSPGFCQTSKRSFNRDETAVVTRITVRAPLTTDDDDERRTIQDGCQSRSNMVACAVPVAPASGGRIPPATYPLSRGAVPLARGRVAEYSGRPRGGAEGGAAGALKVRLFCFHSPLAPGTGTS